MISIAITRRYVHITRYGSGWRDYTKTFSCDRISQYSRNRVYAYARSKAARAKVNKSGVTQYFID